MDTKGLEGSDSISIGLVKDSPTKKLVILSAGTMVLDTKENKQKFQCLVEMDGRSKMYRPNKTTIKKLQEKYGFDSNAWVGKALSLEQGQVNGKDAIIGTPQ